MAARVNPRISVNKLGEYMTASASRRRTIVKDQKHPPSFKAARYRVARDTMVAQLASDPDGTDLVESAVQKLIEFRPETDFQNQERENGILALEAFADIDFPQLVGRKLRGAQNDRVPPLSIGGVEVSVRPEALVIEEGRPVGCVKLHVVKARKLDDAAGAYVATVLRRWLAETLGVDAATLDRRNFILVDVFRHGTFEAPKAMKQRNRSLEAACEEIALRWPSV